jgi:hypothetical protein
MHVRPSSRQESQIYAKIMEYYVNS